MEPLLQTLKVLLTPFQLSEFDVSKRSLRRRRRPKELQPKLAGVERSTTFEHRRFCFSPASWAMPKPCSAPALSSGPLFLKHPEHPPEPILEAPASQPAKAARSALLVLKAISCWVLAETVSQARPSRGKQQRHTEPSHVPSDSGYFAQLAA